MIQHVIKRCEMARNVNDLFVATCDEEISQVVEGVGCKAIMTAPEISRPGLRVARTRVNIVNTTGETNGQD